jgi:hypothetical protein
MSIEVDPQERGRRHQSPYEGSSEGPLDGKGSENAYTGDQTLDQTSTGERTVS